MTFTLPHFIEWLETQPADERYDFNNMFTCLGAQYACHVTGQEGIRWGINWGLIYNHDNTKRTILRFKDDHIYNYFYILFHGENTKGEALQRARKELERLNMEYIGR